MKLFITTIMLVLCIGISASGSERTVQDVVGAVESGYEGLKDLHASFSQTTTLPGLPRAQKGHGELFLRRPPGAVAQFRFDYISPRQTIVSNGKHIWFYQPENRQVMTGTVDTMFKGGNSIALSYLTGLGNLSKDFNATFAKERMDKKGNYLLDLVPRNPNPAIVRLRLIISADAVERYIADGALKDTFPITASIVVDGSGSQTRIEYSRIKVNSGLGAGRFNFRAPDGTEIIKM